jgi:hypothetical protein
LNFDVLIQDPLHDRAFYIPGQAIGDYEVPPETAGRAPAGTVTFVVADASAVDEMPEAADAATEYPSVLLRYPEADAAFLLTYEQLRNFERPMAPDVEGYGQNYWVAYSMPFSASMVQPLPSSMRAMLQSNNPKSTDFRASWQWRVR